MKRVSVTALYITCSIVLSGQVPGYVPASGLMGFWPFTGNANDLSGNNYHGNVSGASLTSDRFSAAASAYAFNGAADITTPYGGVLGMSPRAVSFWARTSHSVTIMAGVAWGSIGTASRYEAGFNYGAPGPMLDGGNGVITYSPPVPAHNNQWHHYVMQFGSSSALNAVQVFQDGVLLNATSNVFSGTNVLNTVSAFNVRFGSIPGSPTHYFIGDLDEIGIWNRPLTLAEITSLYKGAPCPQGNKSPIPCVSLAENHMADLLISPNPFTEELVISSPTDVTITITDAIGKVVHQLQPGADMRISAAGWPPGIYFVSAQMQGATRHYRIIRR